MAVRHAVDSFWYYHDALIECRIRSFEHYDHDSAWNICMAATAAATNPLTANAPPKRHGRTKNLDSILHVTR